MVTYPYIHVSNTYMQVALGAAPDYDTFMRNLGSRGTREGEEQVLSDMKHYAKCMGVVIDEINKLY